jgi:hypothetical protein
MKMKNKKSACNINLKNSIKEDKNLQLKQYLVLPILLLLLRKIQGTSIYKKINIKICFGH